MLKLKMFISSIIIVIVIIIFLYLYTDNTKKDLFTTVERTLGEVDIFYLNNPTNTDIRPDPVTNLYHKIKQEDCIADGSSKICSYSIVEPST